MQSCVIASACMTPQHGTIHTVGLHDGEASIWPTMLTCLLACLDRDRHGGTLGDMPHRSTSKRTAGTVRRASQGRVQQTTEIYMQGGVNAEQTLPACLQVGQR